MARSKRPLRRRPRDTKPVDPADVSLFREAMRRLEVTSEPEPRQLDDTHPDENHPEFDPSSAAGEASRAPDSPPPSVDPADASLFMRAMRQLAVVPDKERASHRQAMPGVRRRRAPKAGTQRAEDRLDLHRSRVEDALVQLERFVQRAGRRGHRRVIVITGKGLHSAGGIAVLRRAVKDWIVRDGRRQIESYSDAPRDEGGRGAFLLYLRPSNQEVPCD